MRKTTEPLAVRMRPRTIDDIVGQEHIIGPETPLYKMIKKGYVPSLLLYGEPGTGKTSLAYAIARTAERELIAINATSAGKKEIEEAAEAARWSGNVLLFIDEIHRLNKAQQDVLLPHLESGLVTLIGATTENPFHEVNPAIRSRCGQIQQLKRLKPADILVILKRALADSERGVGETPVIIAEELLWRIAEAAGGDARAALSLLEAAVAAADERDGCLYIDENIIASCTANRGFTHDKYGDTYYSLLSAFQKSVRGSDADAALHYLARLLEGGDLAAVCRRLLVIAYEDIGLANPMMGVKVQAAVEAAERIGLPEARIPLAVVTIELCLSPKSNSAYKALDAALADVRAGKLGEIPDHLKDAHYKGASILGHGQGYLYPHDYPNGWVAQAYLPVSIEGTRYYEPKEHGEEKYYAKVYRRLQQLKQEDNVEP
ncbi:MULTISPECIES: replication-associated recombination protein A [Geobacillus]|jgi:putative ATPase|uniref:ATPase, AAA family n=2 Tax=Geobacillus thermodenitrificans TaxID=33940 RepID=A4IR91_GEOTN|nr:MULTISPECIES: replication-associated recombination protein A [Geobacillus]ABO67845.1 ATPase, AAA family [Geobacillus thermodenitrificans NG80-2]ARA98979.1 recombinase RarA [Geobacillus thermodenitrificans]ARP43593.1 Replication-associated recombination protein A [Geobacillus thermodenitrificans]ATO38345.1 recombinase RarA [Geobacillus thermodenitrificans]MEC5187274.1 putative ATPase [Geobacillus thermodenitrificans]